jgi:trigger factor
MQTTIETINQLERRMTFGVPSDEVQKEVKKRLARLSKTLKMPGFRPGHVPARIVEQQYGMAAYNEALTGEIQKYFDRAVDENKLRLAGRPEVSPKPADAGDSKDELAFVATFEIYPEVKLPDLAAFELTSPKVEVTDDDVSRTLDTLRKQRAIYEPVDRESLAGDRVMCDYEATIDGKPFAGGEGKDLPVQIGAKNVLPEFENAMIGVKKGDVKEFPLSFPADYFGKEVAGKTAQFKATVKEVTAPVLPGLDEDFAKSLGIKDGNVDTLKSEVCKNLELQLKHRVEALLKEQVMAAIRDGVEVTLPKAMVAEETQRLAQVMTQNLTQQGMKASDIKLKPEMFRERAENNVKLSLALSETVLKNDLQPKQEQVRELVSEVAQTYDDPETVIRWHFERPERLSRFQMLAAERNVVEWAQKTAKVVEKPMSLEDIMKPELTFVKQKEAKPEEEAKKA